MKISIKLFICFLIVPAGTLLAQLSFPNGPTLTLQTSKQILYPETDIRFYTGMYKITDYEWEKQLNDSINLSWDLQACMNGDCKIGLPMSGSFITDFGINDTTGFMRFHVNSYGISGSTRIRYLVRNKINFNDNAVLEFNIVYTNRTGLNEVASQAYLNVFPNPASTSLQLSLPQNEWSNLKVVNSTGQLMPVDINENGLLNILNYPNGLYFVSTQTHKRASFVVAHH
jgi:hypothetical protein